MSEEIELTPQEDAAMVWLGQVREDFRRLADQADDLLSKHFLAIVRGQDVSPWQMAVDDQLVTYGLDCSDADTDPQEALAHLLRVAIDMALDPAISKRAQALVQQGREQA